MASAPREVLISYLTEDGEERSERWPSVERFRAWAAANATRCAWSAFTEDDDGEWVLYDRGRVG